MTATLIGSSIRVSSILNKDIRATVSKLNGQYILHVEFLVHMAKNYYCTEFILQVWIFGHKLQLITDLYSGVGDESRE